MPLIGVLDAPSGPLTPVVVLTRPLTTPFALCADGVMLVALVTYLVGRHRLVERPPGGAARGEVATDRWPAWRTVVFVAGLALFFVAVGSGVARDQDRPSVLVVQHVLLMMAAPPLLIAARPLRPWRMLRPWGAPWSGARPGAGPAAGARRGVVRHPATGWLRTVQGVVSWPLFYGSMAAFFLTPLLGDSVRHPALLDAVECWFAAVGLLFFSGLVGRTRTGAERGYGFRIVALLAGAPLETAVGVALVVWPHPVIAGTSLAATHSAGIVLWISSMAAGGAVLGAVIVQWCLEDTRRGAELDVLLDGSGAMPLSSTGLGAGAERLRP